MTHSRFYQKLGWGSPSATNQQALSGSWRHSLTTVRRAQGRRARQCAKQKGKTKKKEKPTPWCAGTEPTKVPVSSECGLLSTNEQDPEGWQWLNRRGWKVTLTHKELPAKKRSGSCYPCEVDDLFENGGVLWTEWHHATSVTVEGGSLVGSRILWLPNALQPLQQHIQHKNRRCGSASASGNDYDLSSFNSEDPVGWKWLRGSSPTAMMTTSIAQPQSSMPFLHWKLDIWRGLCSCQTFCAGTTRLTMETLCVCKKTSHSSGHRLAL